MANYTGLQLDIVNEIDIIGDSIKRANRGFFTDGFFPDSRNDPFIFTQYVSSDFIIPSVTSWPGKYLHSDFIRDQIYDRIWFTPIEIDVGFITEQRDYTIKIWNAYMYGGIKRVTEINSINPDGTILFASPPIVLNETELNSHTLQVNKDGPSKQDTTYIYKIFDILFQLKVYGFRIVPFLYYPNWESSVKIKLAFNTVVSKTKYLKEQRRALLTFPIVRESFDIWENDLAIQELQNIVIFSQAKIIPVPVYSEPLHLTVDITADIGSIIAEENLDNLWNLQQYNSGLREMKFLLHDRVNDVKEIKEISDINNGTRMITFTADIQSIFMKATTVLYPLILCTLESIDINRITDNLSEASLTFLEINNWKEDG